MSNRKYVFVMDYLPDKVLGGAELSSQALLELCPTEAVVIESRELDKATIDQYKDRYWIFTNVWLMKWALIPYLVKTVKYCIVEYDYKYCTYRSPDMHLMAESIDCHCTNIILDDFFAEADQVFFMSLRQLQWHVDKMPFISSKSIIISSLFSDQTLKKLLTLSVNEKEKDVWGIVFASSALKGFNEAVRYAEQNQLNYRIFKNLKYDELMEALSKCHGLIYKPIGGDTCPRVVIEAKLMGLELDLNYFVQHKDEAWFKGHINGVKEHLRTNKILFWNKVVSHAEPEIPVPLPFM